MRLKPVNRLEAQRMRRGKEMYPSFDTRRVLCKQHRPYCVKPTRARLKPSNVSNAASILSAANGPKRFGSNRSIALGRAYTKTSAEGRSISAWNAMYRLALGSMSHRGWSTKTKAVFHLGESTTGLKQPLRHHLDGYHWKSAQRGRKRRLLCGSNRHGQNRMRLHLGQSIPRQFGSSRAWPITAITKITNNGLALTRAKRGKNINQAQNGEREETRCFVYIEIRTGKNTTNGQSNGGVKTQKSGKNLNANNAPILFFAPCETFAKGYVMHCVASADVMRLSAVAA